VDTRLRKLDEGGYDAILVAAAGLDRLGLSDRISERVPPDLILPAPAQGAIVVEAPAEGPFDAIWQAIEDPDARLATDTERLICASIGADCHSAVGCLCTIDGDRAELAARVCSPDGRISIEKRHDCPRANALALAESVAAELLADGAARVLRMGVRE
jgi:hydroxymethylbilane synthase